MRRISACVLTAAAITSACGGDDGSTAVPLFDVEQGSASQAAAGPGPTDPGVLAGMVLHLPDGPEGATIGDDSNCNGGGHGAEGDSDAFLDLVAETGNRIDGCFIQLEAPTVFVESLVLSFPSVGVAERAMTPAALAGVVRSYGLGCCNAEQVGAFVTVGGPGDDARQAVSPSDTSSIVVWRQGAVVGAISIQRFDGTTGALADAHRLAAVQDERMRLPVVVPDEIDDDRLVGLDTATMTAWWVGETFAPAGYPPMELYMSYSRPGMVELDYDGVRIEIFDRAALPPDSEPDQMLAVTDALFDTPCTVREPIESPAGAAELLSRHIPDEWFLPSPSRSGWDELLDDGCPAGEPNVWMAMVASDDGLLIRINGALCYNCLLPPTPELPYRTPTGLRTIVAALVEYDG